MGDYHIPLWGSWIPWFLIPQIHLWIQGGVMSTLEQTEVPWYAQGSTMGQRSPCSSRCCRYSRRRVTPWRSLQSVLAYLSFWRKLLWTSPNVRLIWPFSRLDLRISGHCRCEVNVLDGLGCKTGNSGYNSNCWRGRAKRATGWCFGCDPLQFSKGRMHNTSLAILSSRSVQNLRFARTDRSMRMWQLFTPIWTSLNTWTSHPKMWTVTIFVVFLLPLVPH